MKPTALILAAAGSLAVVATSPALADHRGVSQREMVQKFIHVFDRLDRNNDNRVSRKDIRRMESRNNHRGGNRTRISIGDENFRISFGTGGRGRHGGGRHIGPINSRTFGVYDLNHNGVIRRKELRRAVRMQFRRADRNGDGYLNQREQNRSRWLRSADYRGGPRYTPDYRNDRSRSTKDRGGRRR